MAHLGASACPLSLLAGASAEIRAELGARVLLGRFVRSPLIPRNHNSLNPISRNAGVLVLPYSDDTPSELQERRVRISVPPAIRGDLLSPPSRVRLRWDA